METLQQLQKQINKQIEQNEKLQKKLDLINTKYRTKYMQLEHERRQWQKAKDDLLDVISKIKVELIKKVPDSELLAVAETITTITCGNSHIALKKIKKE